MKINQTYAYENSLLEKVEHQEREREKPCSTLPFKWTYLPHSYLLLEPRFLVDHHTNKTKGTRLD